MNRELREYLIFKRKSNNYALMQFSWYRVIILYNAHMRKIIFFHDYARLAKLCGNPLEKAGISAWHAGFSAWLFANLRIWLVDVPFVSRLNLVYLVPWKYFHLNLIYMSMTNVDYS